MKNPPNSSEQALEDYFKDLLFNDQISDQVNNDVSDENSQRLSSEAGGEPNNNFIETAPIEKIDAVVVKTAATETFNPRPVLASSMPTPIRSASAAAGMATKTAALRAYAEPIKTLNLRMPLPTLAPAPPVEVPIAPQPTVLKPAEPIESVHAPEVAASVKPALAQAEAENDPPASAPVDWLANGRPAWAQQPFECLLFKVGGLALAAPLTELGSIYPLDTELLTTIFGQAAWFMGLLPTKGYNVRAIDSAQFVMPERYAEAMRAQYRYVITLHGSDWGLAVDAVADSVVLQPADVRWRGQRSKRPWLAGTLVTQMCALLDVAQLIWMFQNQDAKRSGLPAS